MLQDIQGKDPVEDRFVKIGMWTLSKSSTSVRVVNAVQYGPVWLVIF